MRFHRRTQDMAAITGEDLQLLAWPHGVEKQAHILHAVGHRCHAGIGAGAQGIGFGGAGVVVVDQGQRQIGRASSLRGWRIDQRGISIAGVVSAFNHAKLRCGRHLERVVKDHLQATCCGGRAGVKLEQGACRIAIAVNTALVHGIDLGSEAAGQFVEGGAGAAQHLFPKGHQAGQLAAGNAGQG